MRQLMSLHRFCLRRLALLSLHLLPLWAAGPVAAQQPQIPEDTVASRVWTSPEVLWYHFDIMDVVVLLVGVFLLLLFATALYGLRDSIGKIPAKPDNDPDRDPDLDDTQDIPLSAVLNVHNRTTIGS